MRSRARARRDREGSASTGLGGSQNEDSLRLPTHRLNRVANHPNAGFARDRGRFGASTAKLRTMFEPQTKRERYALVRAELAELLAGEDDAIAAMSTIVCELHHAFECFHWTGFYRVVAPRLLAVGPYQGGHGCLRIPFERGVCGAAARTGETQLVPDVLAFPDHIACSATTRSEIVVPVIGRDGKAIAVLDVDSDLPAAFDEIDREQLEAICNELGERFG
jgi:L-methionine (R)-S-oxide reductase